MPLIVLLSVIVLGVLLGVIVLVVLLGVIVLGVLLGVIILVVLLGVIELGVLLGVALIFLNDGEPDAEAFSFTVCILGNEIKLVALPGILGRINENSTDNHITFFIRTNSGQNSDEMLIHGVTSQCAIGIFVNVECAYYGERLSVNFHENRGSVIAVDMRQFCVNVFQVLIDA